jgi:penicillin-binding protein 2
VFDYVLLGHYPSEEDLAAVQKGQAAAPIGKPRAASQVDVMGRPIAAATDLAPAGGATQPGPNAARANAPTSPAVPR